MLSAIVTLLSTKVSHWIHAYIHVYILITDKNHQYAECCHILKMSL